AGQAQDLVDRPRDRHLGLVAPLEEGLCRAAAQAPRRRACLHPVGQAAGARRHAECRRLCLRALRRAARRDQGRRGHDLSVHLEPLRPRANARLLYSTSSTFSGGRPSAALLPETTIGRSTMMGCFAIAAMSCSSDSFAGSMPASAASFLRMSARAGIFNCPSSVFSCAAVYGVFRYSTISGSTPLSRNKASVLREVLQRGL